MRRLEIKSAEVMRIAVQQKIARSGKSRYDRRIHGILLVCSGLRCAKVAELFAMGGLPVSTGYTALRKAPLWDFKRPRERVALSLLMTMSIEGLVLSCAALQRCLVIPGISGMVSSK